MTTASFPPIPSRRAASTGIPDDWEDLLAWIVQQLRSIPFHTGPIPPQWQTLITWILTEVEAAFSSTQGDEKWEESFRSAHGKSKATLDAGAEKVVEHIKELSEAQRAPAAAWWTVAWRAMTEFIVKMGKCIAGVGQTWWEKLKGWFARLKRAIANMWADCTSSGVRLKC